MNTIPRFSIVSIILIILGNGICCYAAKTTKIKLTGTNHEDIMVTVGNTGRTEIITSLPFVIEVPKDQLPLRLKFKSNNYIYYDIDVPKKPFDTTGHVYLVKINEFAMANGSNRQQTPAQLATVDQHQSQSQNPIDIPTIDFSKGVNAAPVTGINNPNTFAIIISNEKYEMTANVQHATNDGLAFKQYCLKTLGIPEKNIRYGTDLSFGRMRKTINDALELANLLDGEASMIIYYAGHGIPDNKTKDAYLMPVDADGTDTGICLSLNSLYDKINSMNLKQCVVFLDACFSGAQRGGDMIVAARGVKLKPKAAMPQGKTIVFSATSGEEAAFAHDEEHHGLFTYFLLEKLQKSQGKVSLGELSEFLSKKVGFESRRINNMPQTPTTSVSIGIENQWKSMKLIK